MTHVTTIRIRGACVIACLCGLLFTANQSVAQLLRPNLGTASTYAVFTGAGSIISTGTSVLTGDVGWNTGGPLTGFFPSSTYTGTYNHGNAATASALQALLNAQTADGLVACGTTIGVGIANGQMFYPGKYCTLGASTTTGTITFDAQGNGNAIFIVDIGGALAANATTHIALANSARAANIYWFVGGAVAIADGSIFAGTIIANGAISFYGTASLNGRALSSPGGNISLVNNNMAISTDTGSPNILVVTPKAGDTIRSNTKNYQITWSGYGIATSKLLEYSLNGGTTWTLIGSMNANVFTYNWNVPDTVSTTALVRITDGNNLIGVSGQFTLIGGKITVVTPALGEKITAGTLNYRITWTGTALTLRKIFELSLDSGLTWKTIDTSSADVMYNWNVPDTVSTKAVIRITDTNGITGKSGLFTIKSSKITIIRPAFAEIIPALTQNYQITWSGTGLTYLKTFELSLDSGLTWKPIGTLSSNLFAYSWNVPDTGSARAMIRITDSLGVTGKSGLFTIRSSKIVVVRPALGEIITGGTQLYHIAWTGIGLTPQKTLDLSLDAGQTWNRIDTITADLTYSWNVPDTGSTLAMIRITDKNGITGRSGIFTIKSSKIIVVRPALREIVVGGTQNYLITWTGVGLATQKTFELSLDRGLTWQTFGSMSADVLIYSWNVPDTASTQAVIRITDNTGITGMSGVFTILASRPATGQIVILHPLAGEIIDAGYVNFPITFTESNASAQKTLEFSSDGGATWSIIGLLNSEALTFAWPSVPDVATTQALIRITDANGTVGVSGLFTIDVTPGVGSINSLTLTGLNSENNAGNNRDIGISWTYTPDIGTSVEVEVSLDYMVTWTPIATIPVSESPNDTSWMTPMTGYYNPVFIRVTSSLGMTRLSSAFSIGLSASVFSEASQNGYSVSNYPNPAIGQTTINFGLPVRSDVTLTVFDNLGRPVGVTSQAFEAGMHDIPFNAAQLADGVYTYTLVAGTTRVSGRMSVIR